MKTRSSKKAILALLLCATMVITMIPVGVLQVNATDTTTGVTYYIDEDFNEAVTFTTATALTTNAWWRTAEGNATQDLTNGNVQVTNLRYQMSTAVTENYTVEFTYQIPSGSTGTVSLSNGNPTSATKQVDLALTGDGAEHTVKIKVDQTSTSKTYDLYVDGTVKSSAQALVNTSVAQFTRIVFASANGNMLIDDVKLYTGELESGEEPETGVTYYIDEDFNEAVTFADQTSLPGTTTWWRPSATGTDKAAQDLTAGNVSVTELRYHMAIAVTENYTFEFEYQLPAGNTGKLQLSKGSPTSATKQVELALTGDGEWHTVKVKVDQTSDSKTYDLYVDGTVKSTANALVVATVAELTRATFTGTSMLIDDVKLYTGELESEEENPEEDPEPSVNYYINEDFNEAVTFADQTGLPSKTTWWRPSATGTDKATQDLTAGNISVTDLRYYMTTPITTDWTMEFKYCVSAGGKAEVSLTNGSHGTSNALAYLTLTGKDATDSDRVQFNNTTSIYNPATEGAWHTIVVGYDAANQKVVMYADGKLLTTTDVSDGWFNPASTKTSVNRVTFVLKSGSLLIDDVKLYEGKPVIEEEPETGDAWTIIQKAALGSNIGMTFTGSVTETSGITSVRATLGSTIVTDSDMSDGFAVTVPVAAAEMAEAITLEALNAEGIAVEMKTYTVEGYLNQLKALDESKYGSIVDYTLNYGACAAVYFGKTAVVAPTGLTLTAVSGSEGSSPVSGECDGITAKSANLLFEDQVKIRYCFELASSSSISDYTFSIGGKSVTPVQVGNKYYVYSDGINPQMYESDTVLKVTKGEQSMTVTYSAMDYIERMSVKSTDTNLVSLLEAMYNYHLAAKTYLAANPNS